MTPLNANIFRTELENHPDQDFVKYIISGISNGFDIGFQGPDSSYIARNMKSIKEHPDIIEKYVNEEVSAGRILGPFSFPPLSNFRCSPIGVVEKKNSGKFRTIMNLSFPEGQSVNDGIDKEYFSLSYITVDTAIDLILSAGRGSFLTKIDIAKAFRQIPINPSQWNLLGFSLNNQFYIDKVLSMGGRSSPAIFNDVAVAAKWVCCNNYGVGNLIHLLDDFLSVEPPDIKQHAKPTILRVFHKLGLVINDKKVVGPNTKLEFLGITLDTTKMEASLSEEKIFDLDNKLLQFQNRQRCTQKELLSLVGSLSFVARVIVPGRSFISRLISKAYTVKNLYHRIRISRSMRMDCGLWRSFLQDWNGKSLFLSRESWHTEPEFSTDASGSLGYGGVFGKNWFSCRWKNEELNWSIAVKELYAVVVACQLWGSWWKGLRVVVRCDNQSMVAAINKGYSKDMIISDLLRVLIYYALAGNFSISAKHIPGKKNRCSDLLSRLQVITFLQENEDANKVGDKVMENPLEVCRERFGSY